MLDEIAVGVADTNSLDLTHPHTFTQYLGEIRPYSRSDIEEWLDVHDFDLKSITPQEYPAGSITVDNSAKHPRGRWSGRVTANILGRSYLKLDVVAVDDVTGLEYRVTPVIIINVTDPLDQ